LFQISFDLLFDSQNPFKVLRSTRATMAEDNDSSIPLALDNHLKTAHRHELISLGLPFTQVYEIKKIIDSDFTIAKPVLLPLLKFPTYYSSNSTTGSQLLSLSSEPTKSTARTELSNNNDRRLSASIQLAISAPSEDTSLTTRKLDSWTQGGHSCYRTKEDWKGHDELHRSNHVGDHLVGKFPEVSNRRKVLPLVEVTDGDTGSFLETEYGDSESTANYQNDPHTSNEGAAGTWLAGIHARIIQSLLGRVNNLLHRGHPSQSQPSTSISSSAKAASSSTLQVPTSGGNSSNRARKRQRKPNHSPGEDSEEEPSNQETPPKSARRDLTTSIEFACPYYKENPQGSHKKQCARGSWKNIAKLKHVSMTFFISVRRYLRMKTYQYSHVNRSTFSDFTMYRLTS
jgi:hypothetical protein